MLNIPPEDQAQLNEALTEAARILRKYTETEKLQDFEMIEIEVREQLIEVVAPQIAEFFFRRRGTKVRTQATR